MTVDNLPSWDDCNDYMSKSRLTTYKWCPYSYKKSYVDGERSESYALTIGSRVHSWLEIFYDYAHLTDDWESFITDDYSDYERTMLLNFIRDERVRLERLDGDFTKFVPRARELPVLDHVNKLRGYIDRITDDETVLEDYKAYLIDKFATNPDILKSEIKDLEQILSGKLTKLICIEEYKTSGGVYEDGLKLEFGFYQLLLRSLPEYKDVKFVGRLINPRIDVRTFIPILSETYVKKSIQKLRDAIANNDFPQDCSDWKFTACKRCTIEECDIYKNCNDKTFTIKE